MLGNCIEGWSENRIEMNLLLLSGSLGLNSISLGHVSIDPSFHGDQDDVSWTTALLRRFLVGGCPRLTACRPNWILLPPPPLQIILWPPPLLHPHQVQRLQFNCSVVDGKCFTFYSCIFPRRRARGPVLGRKESSGQDKGQLLCSPAVTARESVYEWVKKDLTTGRH